jgi:hypothetical protein
VLSTIINIVTVKGLFIRRGNDIVKQSGKGLHFKPYKREGLSTLGGGMYIQNGSNYESVKDVTIKDRLHPATLIGLAA